MLFSQVLFSREREMVRREYGESRPFANGDELSRRSGVLRVMERKAVELRI